MDKAQAIQNFWSRFGWQAFSENSVPTGDNAPGLPYITYSVSVDSIGYPVSLSGVLWDRNTSWQRLTKKADEIADYLDEIYPIKINKGYMYLTPGSPFAQRMSGESDDMVKSILINIQAEFLTKN